MKESAWSNGAQQRRADAMPTLEDNVDGELLEIFSALTHLSNFEFRISNFEFGERARRGCRRLVITVRAPGEAAAASMAREIFSGARRVTAQMVEPEPLRKAPSAPADSAAAITLSRNGMSFLRKG